MLLQVKSGTCLSCLLFTCLMRKIEQWKRAGPLSYYPLCSHEFESHGRHSYKVFPYLDFRVVFFMFFIIFFVCTRFCVLFFVLYFLVVLIFFFFFFFIYYFFLNFYFKFQSQSTK